MTLQRSSKPKKDFMRVNRQIRAREVRVIGADSTPLGVMAPQEALSLAQDAGLDLVEISPNANPPVCKIIDYGKYKYLQKKKAHDARKKQVVVQLKEVKMRPRTDEHDLDFKLKHMRRFLEEGNKAKVTIRFRGREIVYAQQAEEMMARVKEELADVGKVEKDPTMVGRMMTMILGPIGKTKK